ncbi:MAG TPA: hypothetical protein VGI16_00735 [Candidatus Acidoferrum sp.]|jgi:hypothetical protein
MNEMKLATDISIRREGKIRLGLVVVFLAGLFVAPMFLSVAANPQGGDAWEVVKAEYGTKNRHVDVTQIVQRLLWERQDQGRFQVTNDAMGGDPAVGADKVLRVWAQNRRREQREFDYKEGGWLETNAFAVRNDRGDDDWNRRRDDDDRGRPGGLTIIRGFYGVQGQMANVTEILRGMVRGGVLQVRVDNGALGGDPAVGRDKVLIVVYFAQGREQATCIGEGNTLRVP